MTTCSFCGNDIELGTGKIYVKKDGKPFNLCSSKCQRNWLMGRKALQLKWTKTHRDFEERSKSKEKTNEKKEQ